MRAREFLTRTVFNGSVRTCVDTCAAFDAFLDVFCGSFSVHELKDFNGARSHTFPCAFAFIIIHSYGDISFFEFLFHCSKNLLYCTISNRCYYFIFLV